LAVPFESVNDAADAVQEFIGNIIPGGDKIVDDLSLPFAVPFPLGAVLAPDGLYKEGDVYARIKVSWQPFNHTVLLSDLRIQLPLHDLFTTWDVPVALNPPPPVISVAPKAGTLTAVRRGTGQVKVQVCLPGSTNRSAIDTNGVQVEVCDLRVAGTVFHDRDGEGDRDADDLGLNEWRVELLDASGNVLASNVTRTIDGVAGRYDFGRVLLDPAWRRLVIREVLAPGWAPSVPGGEHRAFDVNELIDRLQCPPQIGADLGNQPGPGPTTPATRTPTPTFTRTLTPTPSATATATATATPTRSATGAGPAIVRIIPPFAPQGRRDLELVIEGARFQPGAIVSFNFSDGITFVPPAPPNFGFDGPTRLRRHLHIALAAPIGERRVSVTNPDGLSDDTASFKGFFVTTADLTPCYGDCNRDGQITIDEIVRGINIAGDGFAAFDECYEFDSNNDGELSVNELIQAVNGSLIGCVPLGTPVPTATPTRTPAAPTGDCCAPHAEAGCGIPVCHACVCTADPYCCQSTWDASCVDRAQACGLTCGCLNVIPFPIDRRAFREIITGHPQQIGGLEAISRSTRPPAREMPVAACRAESDRPQFTCK
jgi:hypothetical protein